MGLAALVGAGDVNPLRSMAQRDSDEVYVVLSGWVEWRRLFGAQMTAEGGIPVQVQAPNDSIGFVPVYETREQAQAVVNRLGRPAHIVAFTRKGAIL